LFTRRGSRENIPETTDTEQASSSGSLQTAVFLDEGDFFRIGYEGAWMVLRTVKGFPHLQYLLLHPGEKVHVSDFAALGAQQSGLRGAGVGIDGRDDPQKGSRSDPHCGDVLDLRAKREYRVRLVELRAELDEAVRWADLPRADSIGREIDILTTQLARAFDRRGHARKMSDPMERVRKAVTKRVHDAIDRIAKQNPDLGRHLQNAIHTGYFCWYSPERPVMWSCDPHPPPGISS
jgi:hypothetical protein